MQTKTIKLVNEHLFLSETGQEDLMAHINGQWEDIKVIDVIGLTEEKNVIYSYIEVEYNDYCYLINFEMLNKWAFIYKDEYIEILDELGKVIGEAIEKEVAPSNTILDDVKAWANEQLESYDNIIDVLEELTTYGCQSGNVSFLIYYDDVKEYYSNHYEEINNLVEINSEELDNSELTYKVWAAFERVAHEYKLQLENE